MSNLDEKVDKAIKFIQRAERLALKMQPNHGFWLAFSGGKDSCVILELAKMAKVKFTAYYNITTIDPPELVRFVIEKHPEVVRVKPKETFFEIIKRRKMLPTRQIRFCCVDLKENTAGGYCTITGVRAKESTRRKKQASEVKIQSKSKTIKKELDEMEKTQFKCVSGKDKILINPILEWSEKDVWDFIKKYNVPYCKLYDNGFKRLGCLFCPMATKRERERARKQYQGYYKNLLKSVETFFDKNSNFKSSEDMVNWWFSNKSIKKWQAENYQQYKLNL